MDRKQRSQITTGLMLIAIGLVFLAQRLTFFPELDFQRLWPVFLLIMGFARLAVPGEDGRRGSGGWLVFLGVLFLLHTYEILRLSTSWPLFIVAAGVSIVFARGHEHVRVEPRRERPVEGIVEAKVGVPPVEGDSHVR